MREYSSVKQQLDALQRERDTLDRMLADAQAEYDDLQRAYEKRLGLLVVRGARTDNRPPEPERTDQ